MAAQIIQTLSGIRVDSAAVEKLSEALMSVRSAVIDEFTRVAREHAKELPPLTDSMPLLETGLDSLCFAIIVTRLEDTLGFDPFAAEETLFPMTLGEFVQLYEKSPDTV